MYIHTNRGGNSVEEERGSKRGTWGFKHQQSAAQYKEAHSLRIAVTGSQRRLNQVNFFISEDALFFFFGTVALTLLDPHLSPVTVTLAPHLLLHKSRPGQSLTNRGRPRFSTDMSLGRGKPHTTARLLKWAAVTQLFKLHLVVIIWNKIKLFWSYLKLSSLSSFFYWTKYTLYGFRDHSKAKMWKTVLHI